MFFDKIIKPLFRSKKGNMISRLNELINNQSNIVLIEDPSEQTAVTILDGLADVIDNWDVLLESVADFYVKFDIITAKPVHEVAIKNPERLSLDEQNRFLEETMVCVINNMRRGHPLIPSNLLRVDAVGFLLVMVGMVIYPEVRENGRKLWKHLEKSFSACHTFKKDKHLPKSFIELLKRC